MSAYPDEYYGKMVKYMVNKNLFEAAKNVLALLIKNPVDASSLAKELGTVAAKKNLYKAIINNEVSFTIDLPKSKLKELSNEEFNNAILAAFKGKSLTESDVESYLKNVQGGRRQQSRRNSQRQQSRRNQRSSQQSRRNSRRNSRR